MFEKTTGFYNQIKSPGKYVDGIPNMSSWVENIGKIMLEEALKVTGETEEVYFARIRIESAERERIYNETYYTPTIDELFIGYVCDAESSWGYQHGTWPEVLMTDTVRGMNIQRDPINGVINGSRWLRTEYLTRKQIEEEGWKKSGGLSDGGSLLFDLYEKYVLTAFHPVNKRRISIQVIQEDLKLKVLFDGECKSVNEFRLILKLLNIKKNEE